jgi:hypothetical protein
MDTKLLRKTLNPQLLLEEEEGSISSIIAINPTVLDVSDPDVIEAGDFYLPYSTGFEIECHQAEHYDVSCFTEIPNIMEVNNDSSEQRYRIPSGIKGLICLYHIAYQLQLNNIHTDSGIHYHVDCTDLANFKENKYYQQDRNESLYSMKYLKKYEDLILSELDSWRYPGTYNTRQFASGGSWVRMNISFNTLEFRIGEMTFDYKVLLRRIVHLNAIMRYVKNQLIADYMKEHHPILKYEEEDSIENILKNRTKKI